VTLFESSLKFKDEYHTSKSCKNFDLMTNKPAKIKQNILFKEKTEGGLNLTNIKIYAKSVKFQWIYKLYNEYNTIICNSIYIHIAFIKKHLICYKSIIVINEVLYLFHAIF
jgi:hypothetical protein